MITLSASESIRGSAGLGSSITYTAMGMELVAGVESYKVLAQGVLGTSAAAMYTAPSSTTAFVQSVVLANQTASGVPVSVYVNGTGAGNLFASLTIPANGQAVYGPEGWKTFDSTGALHTRLGAMSDALHGNLGGGALHAAVTTATNGFMSSADKIKLNGVWKDVVAEFGADPTGGVDATLIIQTAVDSFGASGGRLYFPAGTYKVSGTVTISKPVILIGAGRSISAVSMTHASQDTFVLATGSQGAGFEQLRIMGATAGTRTGGFAVNFQGLANVYMQQCDILFMHSGVRSAGALQFLDDLNIREMGANASNGQAVLIDSTGDRYLRRLTTDNPSDPTGFAAVRVRQCSSLVVSDCNLINGGNALDIVPNGGGGTAVASVLVVNTFFDSSVIGCNIANATANDTAHRIRFINCWFSTCSTAGVVINSNPVANINSVDFVGCDFYDNPIGIDVVACSEWSVRASRIAGNDTGAAIGIRTAANAGMAFTISDNFIGNGAGFGANGTGISIGAGSYQRYQIIDNRGLDSNTIPGIIDLGTVGANFQKTVANNMGGNAIASTIMSPVTFTTTELILCQLRIPANSVRVGDTFKIRMHGTGPLAAGNFTFRIRTGSLGTTGDTVAYASAATAGVINGRHGVDLLLVVLSLTTVRGEGVCFSNAAVFSPTAAAPPAATTIASSGVWFITLTGQMSASTSIATVGTIAPA